MSRVVKWWGRISEATGAPNLRSDHDALGWRRSARYLGRFAIRGRSGRHLNDDVRVAVGHARFGARGSSSEIYVLDTSLCGPGRSNDRCILFLVEVPHIDSGCSSRACSDWPVMPCDRRKQALVSIYRIPSSWRVLWLPATAVY